MFNSPYLHNVAKITTEMLQNAQASVNAAVEDATYSVAPQKLIDELPFDRTYILIGWTQLGQDVGDIRYYQCKRAFKGHLRDYLISENFEDQEERKKCQDNVIEALLEMLKIDTHFNDAKTIEAKKDHIIGRLSDNADPKTEFYSSTGLGKAVLDAVKEAGYLHPNHGYQPPRLPGHLRHSS